MEKELSQEEQIFEQTNYTTYVKQADAVLKKMGYTEHALPHAFRTADIAQKILDRLGYDKHLQFLARIASDFHDIGNLVQRENHATYGAVMTFELLQKTKLTAEDIGIIVSSISNHDETSGIPISPVCAALILADKSDVRRSRVRKENFTLDNIHTRVNYAVLKNELKVMDNVITLSLTIDTSICSIMDYFEIFLERMVLCKKAAKELNVQFVLKINETSMS